MPIYAYKCESCGFAKDVLQKMSDSPLTECPTCGASAFKKQLTAAGFQLKGSGWYATDFKGSAAPAGAAADASAPAKPAADGAAQTAAPAKADSPAASASGGCGGGCACH
jgi:putative FmdB family regulatory protein